jgi:tyramine---L-glutamate ligase
MTPMRILVHEFVSGGGLAGRPVTASLAREGSAMLTALVADLAALGSHEIVATEDPRFPLRADASVEVVTIHPPARHALDALIASVDAVWIVAPETDRCLEDLVRRAERIGTIVLGPSAIAIRHAADKGRLGRRLARSGIRHPASRVLQPSDDGARAGNAIGYPAVMKPVHGAGCEGVCLVRNAAELRAAVVARRRSARSGSMVLQQYVRGEAASVSLLTNGRRAVPLTINAQVIRTARRFSYHGGWTPFDHPLAERAADAAVRACGAVPGLRGYVGVDLVLAESEAVVIEVNPRLTTAYLGARAALDANIAALALDACRGSLPTRPLARRSVRFAPSGRIVPLQESRS